MKLHLECERTIHFQKVDGTQGVLKEGAQAYMHFITSKKIDIWMRRLFWNCMMKGFGSSPTMAFAGTFSTAI